MTLVHDIGIALLLLLSVSQAAIAGSATASWDAGTDPRIAGYMLYYGTASQNYTSKLNVGNVTSYVVPNLADGTTYYYAVTAYDSALTESGFSTEVAKQQPFGAPVAQFSASATTGAAPLSLNFTDASSGSITTYAWTFGDGATSNVKNPSHTYSTAGTYTVSLTVTGPGGSNTQTKSGYITVTQQSAAPVAQFTASATSGTAPLAVNFTDASTGSVTTYAWTFGDGSSSTIKNPSHTYAAAGTYTVALTVTGPGGSNTQTKSGYITVTQQSAAPVAQFSANPTSGTGPLAVNFTDASTGTVSTYAWTFGDGATSAVKNPSHSYATVGTYTVSLTVTGPGGSNTQTKAGYITVTSGSQGDNTPPGVPTGLGATTMSETVVSLSWTPSTDNVGVTGYLIERCQGAACVNFAQIGTTSGTTYSNTRLMPKSTYRYRVRATDAAGNLSPYSGAALAVTYALSGDSDESPPTNPQGLTAVATGTNSIALSWIASTDNRAVTSYSIERCQGAGCSNFSQAAVSTTPSYTNPNLSAGSTYSYRVRAWDAAGNVSGFSNVAFATTSIGTPPPANPIVMAQLAYATPQTPQSTVAVALTKAQTAGNLNVVAVGWNDTTASVTSVTDSKGNVYTLAIGPTSVPGALSQSIYYAKNIVGAAAGTNTVTVKFNTGARYADIRVVEYSGLDKVSPVDVTVGASGSASTSNSGTVTTRRPYELLFAANMVTGTTFSAGANFTARVITSPDSDIVQDRSVTTAGAYSATAPVSGSWVMQMVGFVAAP